MNTPDTSNGLGQRFVDALQALEQQGESGLDAMVALFADEATIANPALDLSGTERRGRDGVRAFWTDYCQSLHGASTEFHAMTQGAGTVGLFWTTSLSGGAGASGSGQPARYDGATLLRLDEPGERVAAMHGYYDTRALSSVAQR